MRFNAFLPGNVCSGRIAENNLQIMVQAIVLGMFHIVEGLRYFHRVNWNTHVKILLTPKYVSHLWNGTCKIRDDVES